MSEGWDQRCVVAVLAGEGIDFTWPDRIRQEALAGIGALVSEVIRPAVAEHKGQIPEHTDEGMLAQFGTATDGVRCAGANQRESAAGGRGPAPGPGLAFRIGIHIGDAFIDGDRLSGGFVMGALRVRQLAEANGICVTEDVYWRVEGDIDARFEDLGALEFAKPFREPRRPVRPYSIR